MTDDARGLPARRAPRAPYSLVVSVAPPEGDSQAPEPAYDTAVVNPITGELVPLVDGEPLRAWLVDVKEFEAALGIAKRLAGKAVIDGMDKRRRWTINYSGWKITAPSDEEPVTYPDGRKVYDLLQRLLKEEKIDARVIDECVEVVPVQYKPKLAGLKNLAKNQAIARRLKRLQGKGDHNRTLKVGRG